MHKEFGDELKIASAYIDKVLNWSQIKAEDGKALKMYALFLIGCRNVMEDLDYMDEMDNPTNIRIVISKLPFKMEKWRGRAFEIQEQHGRREAKVVTDPLYREIQSFSVGNEGKVKAKSVNIKVPKKIPQKGFVTVPVEKEAPDSTAKRTLVVTASTCEKPCLFCQKNHTLESCGKFIECSSKERIDFLKSKGLCFGCLTLGHLSKDCRKKMICQQCSQRHPSIRDKKDDQIHKQKKDSTEEKGVSSALVSLEKESCAGIGA